MFHALKGIDFLEKDNKMPNSVQWRSEYSLVNLFCTCGSKRIRLAHTPRGRVVFMWALPMTSLAANVRKPFFDAKGRVQDFQLPIQAGLRFPSSVIKFPFPLSMHAWIVVTLTWGSDISLWRSFKSSSFQAALKAMHHPLHNAWVWVWPDGTQCGVNLKHKRKGGSKLIWYLQGVS